MGGGALLDVGIYCVAPLLAAAGRTPARVEASATLAKSGVDVSFSGWLDFGDGFTATIECSFDAPERQFLEIVGTEASLVVDRAYTPGPADTTLTLRGRDGRVEEIVTGGADPYREMLEHFQTDTADWADIVLPDTTQLEHWDVHLSYGHHYVTLNKPSIAPLSTSRRDVRAVKPKQQCAPRTSSYRSPPTSCALLSRR